MESSLSHRIREGMIGLVFMMLIGAAPAKPPGASFFEPVDPPRSMQIIAHRGMAEQSPENTATALEHCIADGIEWAEIDLRRTRDGTHVLLHDDRLERTTNGSGSVSEIAVEDLQKLDAGAWFAPRFKGTRIPTLQDALRLAKGRLNLYLDCKAVDPRSLIRDIKEVGMEHQVVIYGTEALVKEVRELAGSSIPTMTKWKPAFGTGDWIDRVKPTAVEVDADDLTIEHCRAFHARGIKVEAKTLGELDRREIWLKMLAFGADWIQTDRPIEVLFAEVRSRCPVFPVEFALHRGASRYAPENTIAAIDRAIRLGADYIEIDVRTSRDGKFYLQHDATWNRRTSGKGAVRETDSSEIARLDAGSWFGKPFAGERIPSLEEALDHIQGKTNVYFDAKDIAPEDLVAALKSRQLFDRVVVYQRVEYLKKLKAIAPMVRVMPPLGNPEEIDELVEALHPFAFDTKWKILSKSLIDRCHARNVKVFSDSLGLRENVESFRQAIGWGIDLIQTDHPARLFRALELLHGSP